MNTQTNLVGLARTLLAAHDDAACVECLDDIDNYVSAQLAGTDYKNTFPTIARHLDECVACAESYALIYDARASEARMVAPRPARAPDFSFLLRDANTGARTQRVTPGQLRTLRSAERLRAAMAGGLQRAGKRLHLTLSQALLDLLPGPQGPALAMRSGGEEQALFEIDLDEPAEEITRLHLRVYPDQAMPEQHTVRVTVGVQDRDWPDLADIPVTLTWGDERQSAQTDHWGEAVFPNVPAHALATMAVEVDAG